MNHADTPAWMDDALCAQIGGELWFVEKGESNRAAVRICRTCPVRQDCRDYALDGGEYYGVWGGLLPAELVKIRKLAA